MALLAGVYVAFVARSSDRLYVSRDVSHDELRDVIDSIWLLGELKPVSEKAGRQPWPRMGRDIAFVEALFMDAAGNRAAVSVLAIGSGEARTGLRSARDALCLKDWQASDCDQQFNNFRYEAAPAAEVGEKVLASIREGASGPVVSHTFTRAGMQITLSLQSKMTRCSIVPRTCSARWTRTQSRLPRSTEWP